jgi:hypothetical protein
VTHAAVCRQNRIAAGSNSYTRRSGTTLRYCMASLAALKEITPIYNPGGGYVFSNCHSIQADVPPENVVALFDAAFEHGQYR